jgi:hypothetical protein
MNAITGHHFARAVYLDPEVRADWEQYSAGLIAQYWNMLKDERDEIRCRWLQGRIQAIEELLTFIDNVVFEHRKAELAREPALPS